MIKNIFICYSHTDRKFVQRLANDLGDQLHDAEVRYDEIASRKPSVKRLAYLFDRSDVILAVVSQDYLNSSWQLQEDSLAMMRPGQNNARLIPLIVRTCEGFRSRLDPILFTGDYKEALNRLIEAITDRQIPPLNKDSKARVFVSHSSKDKPFVKKLTEALKGHNLNVWLDEMELQVGDSIVAGVSRGLKNADYLVTVLSKASIGSRWVQAELNAALMEELSDKGVAVLPVLIEDCELPMLLKDRVYADFRYDFHVGLQKLLAVFEQEGESAANAAPEVAITAAPCSQKLSAITLAELRRRITTRMDRGEVSALWFAVLETAMENDMMGRQLSECVISLLEKAKNRNKLPLIVEEICHERPDLAHP